MYLVRILPLLLPQGSPSAQSNIASDRTLDTSSTAFANTLILPKKNFAHQESVFKVSLEMVNVTARIGSPVLVTGNRHASAKETKGERERLNFSSNRMGVCVGGGEEGEQAGLFFPATEKE